MAQEAAGQETQQTFFPAEFLLCLQSLKVNPSPLTWDIEIGNDQVTVSAVYQRQTADKRENAQRSPNQTPVSLVGESTRPHTKNHSDVPCKENSQVMAGSVKCNAQSKKDYLTPDISEQARRSFSGPHQAISQSAVNFSLEKVKAEAQQEGIPFIPHEQYSGPEFRIAIEKGIVYKVNTVTFQVIIYDNEYYVHAKRKIESRGRNNRQLNHFEKVKCYQERDVLFQPIKLHWEVCPKDYDTEDDFLLHSLTRYAIMQENPVKVEIAGAHTTPWPQQ